MTDRPAGVAGAPAAVRAAIGLLTRLPVGAVADDPGAAAFALVGAAIGGLAAVPLGLLTLAGEPVLGAIAAVGVMAGVSGGLHMDGLADTADALVAPDRAAADRARKDPAMGPAGAVTLLLMLAAQVAALASAVASNPVVAAGALVVGGAISRWTPILAVVVLRGRVAPHGLGAWFGARVSTGQAVVGAFTTAVVVVAVTVLAGWSVLVAAVVGIVVGIFTAFLVSRLRGALDGDGMGAAVEVTMTATLVGLAVVLQ